MGLDKEGYWTSREIDSYSDCQYRFVLSDRGRGKSWHLKHKLMRQYRHEGKQFMCLYRQGPDMTAAKLTWLDPLYKDEEFSPEQFRWDGNEKDGFVLYFRECEEEDWEPAGYFVALTMVNRIKQKVYPDTLATVWFDEFIGLKMTKLPGIDSEGDAIRTIVKTIEHDSVHPENRPFGRVIVYLVSNPLGWSSQILAYFRVTPRGYGCHRIGPGIVCEMIEPVPTEDPHGRKQTIDDFLGDECIKNQDWKNAMHFVEPVPKGSVPEYSLRIGTAYFAVYGKGSKKWVVQTRGHTNGVRWFGNKNGLREDENPLEIYTSVTTYFTKCTWAGMLRYDNINTKFAWLNAMAEL